MVNIKRIYSAMKNILMELPKARLEGDIRRNAEYLDHLEYCKKYRDLYLREEAGR
jgi:hypothetical protein